MYQKVHLRLTILCTGITAAIMVVMSLIYLYVSETGLYRNQYNSFKNDMNTIATNLEQQTVISMEWLAKMEAQSSYRFFVLDNGIPFLYNQLDRFSQTPSDQLLLEECLQSYQDSFLLSSAEENPSSPFHLYHVEYEFSSPSTQKDYFGCIINIEKSTSLLQVIIISSIDALEHQILEQRFRFIIIDIITILLLCVFSWFFTGKLLRPIVENHQKQVQFVASASHELRTPLAVILSSVECIKRQSPEGEAPENKFLKIIKQESLRMSTLIDHMLLLSRSDNQHFSIHKKPVELDTLLINAYETFEPLVKEKFILFSIDLPQSALPPCNCDPDSINQAISILMHNAVSYTPEHGNIHLSLSFQGTPHEKRTFMISVADSGIGVPSNEKKKIFDRFYRAEKARSTKGHFGLGLSIAQEIVQAHQGSISVRDSETGGAMFTIALPEK